MGYHFYLQIRKTSFNTQEEVLQRSKLSFYNRETRLGMREDLMVQQQVKRQMATHGWRDLSKSNLQETS